MGAHTEKEIGKMTVCNFVSDNWLSLLNSTIILVGIPAFNAWRNHKWTKKLETYKATLNLYYYRKSSFSKKQLDILEDLWERFIELCWICCEIIDINVKYKKVYNMNEQQFVDYIKNNDDIEKIDKDNILNSSNGRNIFITKMMNKHIDEKIKRIHSFMSHLDKNGIFITPEIKDKFNNLQEILRIAMEIYRQNVEGIKKIKEKETSVAFLNEIEKIITLKGTLEREIQQILFPKNVV